MPGNWRLIPWADCPSCNGEMIADTICARRMDSVQKGDTVRCLECNWRGTVSTVEPETEEREEIVSFKDSRDFRDMAVRELGKLMVQIVTVTDDYPRHYENADSILSDLFKRHSTLQDQISMVKALKRQILELWINLLEEEGQHAALTLPWKAITFDEALGSWGPTNGPGHISLVCEEMCFLVKILGEPVDFEFNGTPATCGLGSTPESTFQNWIDRRAAYQNQ